MNTPTLESAIEASHKALAAILKGDQSGYLRLFSAAEDVTLGNPSVHLVEVARRLRPDWPSPHPNTAKGGTKS